jgi:hypothetical protein
VEWEGSRVACLAGSSVEEFSIVFSTYSRNVLRSALLVLLTSVGACADSQAQKVQCDSQLRPINATSVQKSVSSSAPESPRP